MSKSYPFEARDQSVANRKNVPQKRKGCTYFELGTLLKNTSSGLWQDVWGLEPVHGWRRKGVTQSVGSAAMEEQFERRPPFQFLVGVCTSSLHLPPARG